MYTTRNYKDTRKYPKQVAYRKTKESSTNSQSSDASSPVKQRPSKSVINQSSKSVTNQSSKSVTNHPEKRIYSVDYLLQFQNNCTKLPLGCSLPAEILKPVQKAIFPIKSIRKETRPPMESEETLFRNIQSLLNKLSHENSKTIAEKLQVALTTAMDSLPEPLSFIRKVVDLIFEKGVLEPRYSEEYCQLCVTLSSSLPLIGEDSFKKLFLRKCQMEFETKKVIPVNDGSITDPEQLVALEEARNRMIDRNNGVPRFIGALYLHGIIAEKIIHYCLKTLLIPDEHAILKFAALITLIGKTLDNPKAKVLMDAYFAKLNTISQDKSLPTRVRFILFDVIDLRKNNWIPKRQMQILNVKVEPHKQLITQEGR
jgi:translation initiation factor 4G